MLTSDPAYLFVETHDAMQNVFYCLNLSQPKESFCLIDLVWKPTNGLHVLKNKGLHTTANISSGSFINELYHAMMHQIEHSLKNKARLTFFSILIVFWRSAKQY